MSRAQKSRRNSKSKSKACWRARRDFELLPPKFVVKAAAEHVLDALFSRKRCFDPTFYGRV